MKFRYMGLLLLVLQQFLFSGISYSQTGAWQAPCTAKASGSRAEGTGISSFLFWIGADVLMASDFHYEDKACTKAMFLVSRNLKRSNSTPDRFEPPTFLYTLNYKVFSLPGLHAVLAACGLENGGEFGQYDEEYFSHGNVVDIMSSKYPSCVTFQQGQDVFYQIGPYDAKNSSLVMDSTWGRLTYQ